MLRAHSAIAVACWVLGVADVLYLNVALAPQVIGDGARPALAMRKGPPAPSPTRPRLPASRAMPGASPTAGVADPLETELRPAPRPRDPELLSWTGTEPGPEPDPQGRPSSEDSLDSEGGPTKKGGRRPGVADMLRSEAVQVHFARDRARLTARARVLLEQVASRLLDEPSLRAIIDGHTDQRGENHHNDMLSHRRAERVADYIASRGIMRARMTVRAFGERRPLANGPGLAVNRLNRRVEIRVSPSPTESPPGTP